MKEKQLQDITALYGRLSRDDEVGGESMSIQSQRAILGQYAKEHGFTNCQFFMDDGYSGTNFDRPAFTEMMELVEQRRVRTIIVKDLSRLGRNYLEVGRYTEVIFPENKVRFIARRCGAALQKSGEEHKLFGKGVLLNHSFSTKRCGSIANRFHRMLSGVCPDCGCSRVFSFSHYTTPTKR